MAQDKFIGQFTEKQLSTKEGVKFTKLFANFSAHELALMLDIAKKQGGDISISISKMKKPSYNGYTHFGKIFFPGS